MAELALGLAGAAVAGIPGLGVTALTGFQIGVTLGALLFPPEGPKLDRGRVDEVRLQGASQGAPIPIVYGRNRTAGTIIWTTGVTETVTTSTVGGKGLGGGATTTDRTYRMSLAVLVCEGPITKIRRIWANEKVIYDWRTGGSATVASYIDATKVRVYDGTQTTADAAIEADKGAGNVPAHKGTAYVVFEDLQLAEFGNNPPNFTFEVESAHADLEAAMEDIAARVGLETDDYDFSALTGTPTRGMVVAARTEGSRVMEAFGRANFFEIVETQGKIKAVARTGTSVLSIPQDDIGAAPWEDTETSRYVETTRAEEVELPREFVVSYQSEALDFQQWTQTARRTTRWSENQEQVNFPMSLGDAYARYLADAFLMERWAARAQHRFTLPYKYLRLDPGDVVTIPDEAGRTRAVRIVEMNAGLLAQIEVSAVDDDPIIYVDPGLPASIPTGGGAGLASGTGADLLVFETNAPYDRLADLPQIGSVAGRPEAGWRGGYAETDPPLEEYGWGFTRKIGEWTSPSTFGYTTADANGVLGNTPGAGRTELNLPYDFDTTNTVRVTLTSGSLSSCTYDELVQEGRNLCAIGKEILAFQTATLISGTTYELSNLLRYRRGTDYLVLGLMQGTWDHAQEEGFVLFNAGVASYAYEPSFVGTTQNFRIIETGKDYGGGLPAYSEPLVLGGDTRKPYGPCSITATFTGDRSMTPDDVELAWIRRVRKRGGLMDYADAPLDEVVESYEIEIWSDDLTTLLNTYTSLNPNRTYTIAEQIDDGVSDLAFQVVVYQVSAEPGIGRGHPSLPKQVGLIS